MTLLINPELTGEDPGDGSALPEGVLLESQEIPADRVELFRVNGRVYTIKKSPDQGIVFKYLRDVRNGGEELAAANMLYELLGDAAMDVLADEKLEDDEYAEVMKAVQKHTMQVAKRTLGNSSSGRRR